MQPLVVERESFPSVPLPQGVSLQKMVIAKNSTGNTPSCGLKFSYSASVSEQLNSSVGTRKVLALYSFKDKMTLETA